MNAVFNTSFGKVGLSTAPLSDNEISEFNSNGKLDLSKTGLSDDFKGTWGLSSKAYVVAAVKNHSESLESHVDMRSKIAEQAVEIAQLKAKIGKILDLLSENGISLENALEH